MTTLVLGPLTRYADATTATVWVETDGPCSVEVAGVQVDAFEVAGHWYAYLAVEGLAPGSATPYDVRLDGERVWPRPDDPRPPPLLRPLPTGDRFDLVAGSCRTDRPHCRPWVLDATEHPDGVGPDALHALALACRRGERPLPDLLLLLGDQVYADDGLSPALRQRQVARRGDSEPRAAVADFEEYTWLYRDAWSQPEVRWLLSTVPSAMIFDDHEVMNGWNSSAAWRASAERLPWWPTRVEGAYGSYWLYQHLGNLPPAASAPLLAQVREQGVAALRAWAERADGRVDEPVASGFSYVRELGPARLVVLDARGGRELAGERRSILSQGEWERVAPALRGNCAHLLVASSVPVLLEPSLHDLERWDEAVAGGRWGSRPARLAEWLRQLFSLEHWAAFSGSFDRLVAVLHEVATGRRGSPPSTVLLLSGDVHHSYVARLRFADGTGVRSAVVQVVSSPFRQAFGRPLRAQIRLASTPLLRAGGRLLTRLAGLPPQPASWTLTTGPLFGNGLAEIWLDGRTARLRLDAAVLVGDQTRLRPVHTEVLQAGNADDDRARR